MKSGSRKQIAWGAVATTLLVILIQAGGEYLKMQMNGDIPSPAPTIDQRPTLATLGNHQETDTVATAQRLSITLEPSAGALENLYQLRVAQSTPQPDLLLTYCQNTTVGTLTPDQCRAWVDQMIEEHAADVAYCQAQTNFRACLTERSVPTPSYE